MNIKNCKFTVTQIVSHRDGSFRGMIVDIDPWFMGSEEWYQNAIHNDAPVEEPWYYVVIDGADYATYAPEKDLVQCTEQGPVVNPIIKLTSSYRPKARISFSLMYSG